jgi:hypothetical protein
MKAAGTHDVRFDNVVKEPGSNGWKEIIECNWLGRTQDE